MCQRFAVPSVSCMGIIRLLVPALVLGGVGGCAIGGPARADETDRIAEIVALAIDSPRQADATGYARAAAATRAGQDGRLAVIRVDARRIVLRVHLVAIVDDTAMFGHDEPEVTTCYDVGVDVSGVGDPERVTCPAAATPVALPPPLPHREIPTGADAVVRTALRRTPRDADALRAAVRKDLAAPASGALAPEVLAATDGTDIGLSVGGEGECLLGSRVAGRVLVWRPSRVQVQPGELSCDPSTALGREGITPPH
jgi:hypothetical protein